MKRRETGKILLGTVHGDIHDLGKNLFGMVMTCHGFKVIDIGVDIPPEEFVSQSLMRKPDIIGLSGLLTIAFDSMRETVTLLKNSEDPQIAKTPIILGSSLLKSETCKYIGADYWTKTAMAGVNMCKQIIAEQKTLKPAE